MADSDVGKLFVGGISRDTNETTLRDYFTKYGDVSSSIIAKDRLTGGPRGFGFVTFVDPLSVDKALQDHHVIAGRTVEVKKAIPRNEQQTNSQKQQTYYYQQQYQQQEVSSQIYTQPQGSKLSEESYWPRGPGYGNYPNQVPVSTTYPGYYYGGVYGGGYPVGGYGVVGYRMPLVAPRSPWNGFGVMGVPPMAYGTGYYPTGMNGGVPMMGMVSPYNSTMEPVANGKPPDQDANGNTQLPNTKDAVSAVNGGRSDADVKTGKGFANFKKSSRVLDAPAQSKATPVTTQSS